MAKEYDDPRLQAAFERGFAERDLPARVNPYQKGTDEHRAWCVGWASDYRKRQPRPSDTALGHDIKYDGWD